MNEKNFKVLAMVISMIGLLILYIMTLFVKYEDYALISEQDQKVKIKGEISSYKTSKNITKIKIKHTLVTDAVIFDKTVNEKLEDKLKKSNNETIINKTASIGKNITIIGKVDNYKGKRQLIVEEVK